MHVYNNKPQAYLEIFIQDCVYSSNFHHLFSFIKVCFRLLLWKYLILLKAFDGVPMLFLHFTIITVIYYA